MLGADFQSLQEVPTTKTGFANHSSGQERVENQSPRLSSNEQNCKGPGSRDKLKSEGKAHEVSPEAVDSEFPTENSFGGMIPPPSFHVHMLTAGCPSCAQSDPKKDKTKQAKEEPDTNL